MLSVGSPPFPFFSDQGVGFAQSQDRPGGEGEASMLPIAGPELLWATYVNSEGGGDGRGIAVDSAGNILVVGTAPGGLNTFVAKMSSTGQSLWSTLLGTGWCKGWGIAVDSADHVLVTGETEDPVAWISGGYDATYRTPSGYTHGFVAKLDSGGEHLWSSYVGGDYYPGRGVVVDSADNVLVTGKRSTWWQEDTGPTFVEKLSPTGEHLWTTYLGGDGFGFEDGGFGIAVDSADRVLVTGTTGSSGWVFGGYDEVNEAGSTDAFAVTLTPAGHHLWSTFLGGHGAEAGYGISVDAEGNLIVIGDSHGSDFPIADDTHWGAFVAKIRGASAPLDPGDTLEMARNLGALAWDSPVSRAARIGDGAYSLSDVDLYQFTLAKSGPLEARLTTFEGQLSPPDLPLNGVIRLFDNKGKVIAAADTETETDAQRITRVHAEVVTSSLPTGVYYLGISGLPNRYHDPSHIRGRNDGSTGAYRLEVVQQGPSPGSWQPTIAVGAQYDGNADPMILGQFLVGQSVDPLSNVLTVDVGAPEGFTTKAVAFDKDFDGVRDDVSQDYWDTDASGGWTWALNVSELPGDVKLRVWAQEATWGTWSEPLEIQIKTLKQPDWMDPDLTEIWFDKSEMAYRVQSLKGKAFGKYGPDEFPEFLRGWNGLYAGVSLTAVVKLSGEVVGQSAVPELGFSLFGKKLLSARLTNLSGFEARYTFSLSRFCDLFQDPESYKEQNQAKTYKSWKIEPEVTIRISGSMRQAMDDQLELISGLRVRFAIQLNVASSLPYFRARPRVS